MDNYEKILAMWRTHKLEVAADIDRALDNFKTSFAFQSGRLTNPQITYHDTVSIFEKDSVAEYTGVVRSLLEQRNQRLAYEFTRAKLVERAPLDIPLVLEVHKLLTNGTYNQSHYIDNGERPGEFKKHDYGVGLHEVGVPASRVEREVGDLLAEVNGYTGPWTLMAAAYLHARFEHLHPFADGNGRVGRTLVNYYLIQHDHPPLVFFEHSRRTITPHWTPMTCRRIWSRWSGFSGECWRIPGKPSFGRWRNRNRATSPWRRSRGRPPVEPCVGLCARSEATVEEVPAQGSSGGRVGPVVGWFRLGSFTKGNSDSRRRVFKQEKSSGLRPHPEPFHNARQRRAFQGIPGLLVQNHHRGCGSGFLRF